MGVTSSTLTAVVVPAGNSVTSTTADSCTCTVKVASNLFMPGETTTTWYGPGITDGNSSIRAPSKVWPKSGLSVVTMGVTSSTLMAVVVPAGNSVTSTTADSCTCTVKVPSNLFMPGETTTTWYEQV